MTTTTKRLFENLGLTNHGVKGNMWRIEASDAGKYHYISAHLNPLYDKDNGHIECYLLMCSCRAFTVGIPSAQGNPFIEPCRHIKDFDESEVDMKGRSDAASN